MAAPVWLLGSGKATLDICFRLYLSFTTYKYHGVMRLCISWVGGTVTIANSAVSMRMEGWSDGWSMTHGQEKESLARELAQAEHLPFIQARFSYSKNITRHL